MEIEGKKAVVVGGASGFGRATAEALAKRGASVAVLDRPQSNGKEVADAIGGAFYEVDITDFEGTEAVLASAVEGLGGLHIAVTTAGGNACHTRRPVPTHSIAPAMGMLMATSERYVPARRRSLSSSATSSFRSEVGWPAVTASLGKAAMKSRMVASGSRPTSTAYDRTNARPKMPPGRREMSLRSSASSTPTEIFVALAI